MLEELLKSLQDLLSPAEAEGRDLTDEEAERAAELTGQINAARTKVEIRSAASELLKPRNDLHIFAGTNNNDDVEKRFDTFLRTGGHANGAEFRAQGEGVGSQGGYLVPTTFRNKLQERRLAYGGFQLLVESFSTSDGQPVEWPTVDDTANIGGIVAENASYPGSDGADFVFGIKTLGAYKYGSGGAGSLPMKVSLELLQDSAFNVQDKVANALSVRIARAQAPHWLKGTGVGQPEGLLTNKAVSASIASTTVPTYGELVTFVHSLDPAYREGACFVTNDKSLGVLQGILDSQGRPLYQDFDAGSLASNLPGGTLLGYKLVIDQAMPDIATSGSTKWLAFGKMDEAYVIRRVADFHLVVLNELYAANGQVGFLGWERADGCVQDPYSYTILGSHT